MSSTTAKTTTVPAAAVTPGTSAVPDSGRRSVAAHGVLASVGAAAATTAAAAVASAMGVSFADRTGATIPTLGFTELTLVFSLIGVGLAAVLARRAKRPRSTFLRTTGTLVLLSFVPDVVSGFDAATAVTLILIHLLAAAIVVPTLAKRLAPVGQPKQGR
jgi:amino acid transporter